MKHILLKIKTSILLVGIISLTGCLDDKDYALDPSGTPNIIQFLDPSVPASPAGAIYPLYVNSYQLAPTATYQLSVSYAGPNKNTKDIQLSLAVDPAALDLYNTQMHDGLYGKLPLSPTATFLDLMPEDLYDAPTSIIIPAGQKTATFTITFYPESFDFSKNYALPIRIASASSGILSEHWSVAILGIGVRNQYDGVYTYTGSLGRYDAAGNLLNDGLAGPIVAGVKMSLTTASSNTLQFLNSQGSQLPMWASGASGVAGIGTPLITVNPDNSVTLTPVGESPLDWGPIPGEPNEYDPDTKTFKINYKWNTAANASPGSPTGTNRALMITMTFIEPRP